jgi:hypothetical protein
MRLGRYFSPLRSKLQLLSVRFFIPVVFIISLFLIYQRIIVRDGQQLFDSPLKKRAYKYNLMEKYEQEHLSDDDDPPFKRILFWNDVR